MPRGSAYNQPMANALTSVRLLLVLPFAWLMTRGDVRSAQLAAVAMIVAIVTDLLDGSVARRLGTVSPVGGTLDHVSDFLFVTCGLFAGATRGVFPWILPALIAAAFAQYFIDSHWVHRTRALRGSTLGRYNGILYFVPLCGEILIRLGLRFLQPALVLVVWLLVLSTLVSMSQRVIAARRAAASPAGGTAGR